MTTYIFIVALLNLALGYGLAILTMGERTAPLIEPAPAPEPPVAPAMPAAPVVQAPTIALAPAVEEFAAPVEETPSVSPAPTISAEQAMAEATLDEFKEELERYRERLAGLNLRVQECAEAPAGDALQECLRDLQDANTQYVEQQEQAAERAQQQPSDSAAAALRGQLGEAVSQQTEQIKTVNRKLSDIDLEADLLAGCQALLNETSRLTDVNENLDQRLTEARRELAEIISSEAEETKEATQGTQTNLPEELARWWTQNPDRTRASTLCLLELDRFAAIEQGHGQATAELVLTSVSGTVAGGMRGDDRLVVTSGQRFLLMLSNTPARDATSAVERLRQLVAATRFRHADAEIDLTMSCSVAEANADDTVESLLARGEKTLEEAKHQGGNRTFMHEGSHAIAVVPPNFAIDTRVVAVG